LKGYFKADDKGRQAKGVVSELIKNNKISKNNKKVAEKEQKTTKIAKK
jgi:hypothetical protein